MARRKYARRLPILQAPAFPDVTDFGYEEDIVVDPSEWAMDDPYRLTTSAYFFQDNYPKHTVTHLFYPDEKGFPRWYVY